VTRIRIRSPKLLLGAGVLWMMAACHGDPGSLSSMSSPAAASDTGSWQPAPASITAASIWLHPQHYNLAALFTDPGVWPTVAARTAAPQMHLPM
jgi:hypothetical protein